VLGVLDPRFHACHAPAPGSTQSLHTSADGALAAFPTTMPSMLVTCPETAHLEQIDLDVHPLGILIRTCSALGSSCASECCPRTCAARLDRRLKRTGKLGALLLFSSCLRDP
jgi:hypothetical protein